MGKKDKRYWCPICWAEMEVITVEDKTVFKCPNHGQLNFGIDHYPLSANGFTKHCDSLGITDSEAPF